MEEEAKTVIDAFAVGGTVGALAGWLPPLAALVTLIWTCLRIWETKTVQELLNAKKDDGE
jgi:chromate transport protein ChrA|tara:strand:- start:71 stop:250 length:180 start_codon:yes stop_codon:yes gene_type:complete